MEYNWTNESVLALAGGEDPVGVVRRKARALVIQAAERGWTGPPFEPLDLASLLEIEVHPRNDVTDARVLGVDGSAVIEFNPNRPRTRMRFSLAHEIAHTLFPDFADRPRERAWSDRGKGDEWQLEALCNMAAAELLMPVDAFESLAGTDLDLNSLITVQTKFGVSTEALLLRAAELSSGKAAAFVASRVERRGDRDRYRLDYVTPGTDWTWSLSPRTVLPERTVLADCTAVGFSSYGEENWLPGAPLFRVQCVGVPPYPGGRYPRVAGLLDVASEFATISGVRTVVGDALNPRDSGTPRFLVQLVNDRATRWGGGFARAVASRWPAAHESFQVWARTADEGLALGSAHFVGVESDLTIASLVAQRGIGKSVRPRIRYQALSDALGRLADEAARASASIHMPMIGTGESRGNWSVIRQLLHDHLVSRGIEVTIYRESDSVSAQSPAVVQARLPLG